MTTNRLKDRKQTVKVKGWYMHRGTSAMKFCWYMCWDLVLFVACVS